MAKTKLSSILISLSDKEKSDYRKHLQNHPSKSHKELLKLFNTIDKIHNSPPMNSRDLALQSWSKIYPSTPLDMNKWRKNLTRLSQSLFEFLTQNLSEEEILFKELTEASTRGLDKYFDATLKNINTFFNEEKNLEPERYLWLHKIAIKQHQQLEGQKKKNFSFDYLDKADQLLDLFYYAKKLDLYINSIGFQLSTKSKIKLNDDMITKANEIRNKSLLINLNLLVKEMFESEQSEEAYQNLKESFARNIGKLHAVEKQKHIRSLMNYCVYLINKGKAVYFQELFTVYELALKEEIIIKDGRLNQMHFRNIITVGLHLKHYNWTESFIQNYANKTESDDKSSLIRFNLAKLYFHKKDYTSVIGQLKDVEYNKTDFQLGSKILLLQTYYELGEEETLDALCESFRIYLLRNKNISNEYKQQYYQIIKFVRKLIFTNPYEKDKFRKLKAKAMDTQSLVEKKWIIEKIEEKLPTSQ